MNIRSSRNPMMPKYILLLVTVIVLAGLGSGVNAFVQDRRVSSVAERGAQVMPFDLDATTHTFERVEDGGLQTVTADSSNDQGQIRLIQEHLRKEADAFRRGDFSDPARIHGEDMPGLKELQAGANRITVQYSELPAGAQIQYVSGDLTLIHALHGWFDAQVSDHGEHAEDGMQH